jgi:hypothetical protein
VIHPSLVAGKAVDQAVREEEFKSQHTEDDHLVHAVDHRVLDGRDWYLIKNSHGVGSGRRGYVWIRDDWFALRVLGIMVNKDAIPQELKPARAYRLVSRASPARPAGAARRAGGSRPAPASRAPDGVHAAVPDVCGQRPGGRGERPADP